MTAAQTSQTSRPAEGPVCRVVNITTDPAGCQHPFVLTAACGWWCTVEQGVEWGRSDGRRKWAAHECLPAAAVTA